MNENVNSSCICELGFEKGALKKTIENNVFTIYGNTTKNNYIVLRYHGKLIDNIEYNNYKNDMYISYYFDQNKENTKTLPLAKCSKCIGENYCTLIFLEDYSNISFDFFIASENSTMPLYTEETSFNLPISFDPLISILQKYGVEDNKNLPVAQNHKQLQISKFISWFKQLFSIKSKRTC